MTTPRGSWRATVFAGHKPGGKIARGNQASVELYRELPDDDEMAAVAAHRGTPVTTFVAPMRTGGELGGYDIAWRSPHGPIELCGHGTLAAGAVLYQLLRGVYGELSFLSERGDRLEVSRQGDRLALALEAPDPAPRPLSEELREALGVEPLASCYSDRYLLVLENEAAVRRARPDFDALRQVREGFVITAPGRDCDVVFRYFAPAFGDNEDAATGSAMAALVPLWSAKLGVAELHARQLSARGGEMWGRDLGGQVEVLGRVELAPRVRAPAHHHHL